MEPQPSLYVSLLCISPETCAFSACLLYLGEEKGYLRQAHSTHCPAQQASGGESTMVFCPSCSEHAAGPRPSGSIRFVVEVLSSCICACDGSAPFKRRGFAERVQTICPGKTQRKTPVLVPTVCGSGPACPWGRTTVMSGRAFPAGDHVSGVSGAVCANPPTLLPLGILHHGTDCAACTPRGQGSAQGCFLCHTKQGAQSLSPL